jgi:hypothetical protein
MYKTLRWIMFIINAREITVKSYQRLLKGIVSRRWVMSGFNRQVQLFCLGVNNFVI